VLEAGCWSVREACPPPPLAPAAGAASAALAAGTVAIVTPADLRRLHIAACLDEAARVAGGVPRSDPPLVRPLGLRAAAARAWGLRPPPSAGAAAGRAAVAAALLAALIRVANGSGGAGGKKKATKQPGAFLPPGLVIRPPPPDLFSRAAPGGEPSGSGPASLPARLPVALISLADSPSSLSIAIDLWTPRDLTRNRRRREGGEAGEDFAAALPMGAATARGAMLRGAGCDAVLSVESGPWTAKAGASARPRRAASEATAARAVLEAAVEELRQLQEDARVL